MTATAARQQLTDTVKYANEQRNPQMAESALRRLAQLDEQEGAPTTVVAEDAPIGVLLWPVRAPRYASAFTLARVEVVRDCYGTHVRWVYENGNERTFHMGERVSVRFEPTA